MTTLDEVRADDNVVAAFADLLEARAAILAVEQTGIDPEMISLLGAWPGGSDTPQLVLRRSAVGAAVGGLAGGLLAVGLAATISGFDSTPMLWAAGLLGPTIGGVLGGLLGAYAGTGSSSAWEDTFAADEDGNIVVGVHSDDAADVDYAEVVLRTRDALAVNRFRGRSSVR